VPVNNVPMVGYLDPLPTENFAVTDGVVLRSSIKGLRWVLNGLGTGLRYHMLRRSYFTHQGVPCNRPPWGMLVAVDVEAGEIRWRVPLGQTPEGVSGAMNFGPPLATASELVFVGGTAEPKLRAFDARDGRLLATFDLPAGLHAGPMTYQLAGKQYLVIAAGGHAGLPSPLGGHVIAYTLPDGSRDERVRRSSCDASGKCRP
jgi:glucose dehydrogenase